jgi:hypothetical protein
MDDPNFEVCFRCLEAPLTHRLALPYLSTRRCFRQVCWQPAIIRAGPLSDPAQRRRSTIAAILH